MMLTRIRQDDQLEPNGLELRFKSKGLTGIWRIRKPGTQFQGVWGAIVGSGR